ncbi:T9SS type A sorting domain-containing protein [Melioribacteraceae bacterium 4301-Me]|uniref:T9SS type A sorting domain-containing protein n=1 Tax=Pyranulibacter aquaticus TaxID=3163344 RepID=UPI003597D27B
MYICQWVDTDLGYSADDFIGCDTSLNMGYSYNSNDYDKEYSKYLSAPPAIGYVILQGVSHKTNNLSDSAIINFKWRKGYKYFNSKPLTAALLHRTGGSWSDPTHSYNGTLEFYNMMRGFRPMPSYPNSLPFSSDGTDYTPDGVYMLDGDPVIGTGPIDGIYDGAGDRRMWLVTGPFSLKLNDTAEVVIAQVGGIGLNHLDSITKLRYNAEVAALFYNDFVYEMTSGKLTIPHQQHPANNTLYENYALYQNYPNPFNSTTKIRYELPAAAHVILIVYDILGKEVRRLVDDNKSPGSYSVNFNADGLPSGVYFYKITFLNQDNKLTFDKLYKVNKLILLR